MTYGLKLLALVAVLICFALFIHGLIDKHYELSFTWLLIGAFVIFVVARELT